MAEENKTAAPQAANTQNTDNAPVMSLQKLYVKDVSFETPNAPDIFNEKGQPEIKMNLNQKVKQIAEGTYEIVLAVTVTCKILEKTAYLVEVHQAGIFSLKNFEEKVLHLTLGSYCPNVLFPYARQMVSDLVMNGGFQPLLLQPVNFDQLYAQQMQQAQAQAETATKQ
ncbi:Protein-export protein SecB (maintains pre-export unfolded state) [hydrothermal vent metagenome]|uniref:Protein-export protein SecB (Maintains pre-export unfolded state) n=1 Tax=hydrothermal vent metagenome TaxID=652676 RepID=A0A3B0UXL5_9ZZZZ